MNPWIQLQKAIPLFFIAFLIVWFGPSQESEAVTPPPDGGYPGGNTAEGQAAFLTDAKFARYYAPTAFNTPQTMEEIFKSNDVQLFDLQNDPDEVHNLALAREKNKELILRMNGLLNEIIAKEVGVNDGRFLAPFLAPK